MPPEDKTVTVDQDGKILTFEDVYASRLYNTEVRHLTKEQRAYAHRTFSYSAWHILSRKEPKLVGASSAVPRAYGHRKAQRS